MQQTCGLREGCRLEAVRLLGCRGGGYSFIGDFSRFFDCGRAFSPQVEQNTEKIMGKNKRFEPQVNTAANGKKPHV